MTEADAAASAAAGPAHAPHPSDPGAAARPPGAARRLRGRQRQRAGPVVERRRAGHHARFRLLALVHDALPHHRGPRRGRLRACSSAACGPSRATGSGRSTSPPARCTACSGSPASTSAPGGRTAPATAACGSTASPRPRAPACARSCCIAASRRRRPRRRPPPRRRLRSPRPSWRAWTPRWVRYAPFTLSGLVSIGVVVGFLANVAYETHFDPERYGPLRDLADRLDRAPVALTVAALVALAARGRGGGLDGRLRTRVLGLPADAPLRRNRARDARADHHPRDDDRGAPAARRRDQRDAAAADGRGRSPDRDRHRPARRPRSRAGRIAAGAARIARRGASAWPPRSSARRTR